MSSQRILAFALACAALPAIAAPSAYQVIDLGPSQWPLAFNPAGTVVGRTNDTGRADTYDGTMWTLLPVHTSYSGAEAINRRGEIVGEDGLKAVRWRHGQRQLLRGIGVGTAEGIADDGAIVGTQESSASPSCYLLRDGIVFNLGTLGGTWCRAHAIDPTGQYIGGESDVLNAGSHGFVRDAQGTLHDIGILPNGAYSWVRSVNRHGHASAWADIDNGGDWAAAFWNGHRLIEVPGVRAGGVESIAGGINSHDQMLVVGDDGAGHDLFLYEGRTGEVTALEPRITNGQGWNFHNTPIRLATDIEDDGRIIGSAFFQGEEHGYMLVPVSP